MEFLFKDDTIFFGHDQRIAIENIAFAGELTTAEGPDFPDFFIVIGDKSGVVLEIPWGEFGKPFIDMVDRLKSQLSVSSFKELIGETNYSSIVHFPSKLAGEPIYYFEEEHGTGFGSGIRRVLGMNRVLCKINPRLAEFLNDRGVCCRFCYYRLTEASS